MSIKYITRPMTLDAFIEVAGGIGWTATKNRSGATVLATGGDTVLIEGEFTAGDGKRRVMFTMFAGTDPDVVERLAKATRALDEYRPGYDRLINDDALRSLGWL